MKKRMYNFPIEAPTDKIVAIDGITIAEPTAISEMQSFIEMVSNDDDGPSLRMVFNQIIDPPLVPAITLLDGNGTEYTSLGEAVDLTAVVEFVL